MKCSRSCSTVATALAGSLLAVFASGAGAAAPPRAQLSGLICQKALDPPARAVSITAQMRPLTGTQRMEMKFDLLSRASGVAAFTAVPGKGLDTWVDPPDLTLGQRPGDIWIVHHPVANLAAPATYRFAVSFRWIGSHGEVLGTVLRTSRSCHQPELRPDLLVQTFSVVPIAGQPKLDEYVAVIGNAGATAARNFEVEFSDATKVTVRTIKTLAPYSTARLTFTGPACTSTAPPTLTLDPQKQVDDFNRANNVATAVCS